MGGCGDAEDNVAEDVFENRLRLRELARRCAGGDASCLPAPPARRPAAWSSPQPWQSERTTQSNNQGEHEGGIQGDEGQQPSAVQEGVEPSDFSGVTCPATCRWLMCSCVRSESGLAPGTYLLASWTSLLLLLLHFLFLLLLAASPHSVSCVLSTRPCLAATKHAASSQLVRLLNCSASLSSLHDGEQFADEPGIGSSRRSFSTMSGR